MRKVIKRNPEVVKTYKITEEQVIQLISYDLGVPVDELSIAVYNEDTSDEYDMYDNYVFAGFTVTHKPK